MNSWIRQLYKGVSWRSPVLNGVFRLMDIPDAMVRAFGGRSYLPPFSIRVRSRGVANQFGGKLFRSQGDLMIGLLEKHAGISPDSDVLEVGCGCGCAATALVEYVEGGTYTGLDIDTKSINFCKNSKRFPEGKFKFEWINVFNSQWNPDGEFSPEDYTFPIESGSKDIIFLTSVFTHMLPASVDHYFSEFSRILKPGGRVLTTVFLMDHGHEGSSINFPYEYGDCRVHQTTYPERGVGYEYEFLRTAASGYSLVEHEKPILGNWRSVRADGEGADSGFGQDIVVFCKK